MIPKFKLRNRSFLQYCVPALRETGCINLLLKPKDGTTLEKIPALNHRPDPEYLAWHRSKHRF
jgi:hypothetical protein